MEAMEDEAHKLGLRDRASRRAWKRPTPGTTSSSAPPASSTGTAFRMRRSRAACRTFPPSYNYNNETDRFRYAGHLWREANPERLGKVLDGMVKAHVAWVPTLDIYEASRDLQRAQNQPWFARISASHAGGVFRAEPGQPRLVLSGLDLDRRDVLEGELPPVDGGAARIRPARRPDRHGRRCRLHLPDVRLRADSQHGTAPGGGLPSASRSSSRPPATTRRSWGRRRSWDACAPGSRRT